jgi:hypothetical protein
LRDFLREVEALRVVIQRCWNDETGSKLVALECLRVELQAEFFRVGVVTDASKPRPLPAFRGSQETDFYVHVRREVAPVIGSTRKG